MTSHLISVDIENFVREGRKNLSSSMDADFSNFRLIDRAKKMSKKNFLPFCHKNYNRSIFVERQINDPRTREISMLTKESHDLQTILDIFNFYGRFG